MSCVNSWVRGYEIHHCCNDQHQAVWYEYSGTGSTKAFQVQSKCHLVPSLHNNWPPWITDSFYVAFVFWTVMLVAVEHSSVLRCSTELLNYAMETWWLGSETLLWLVTTLWDRCLPRFPYSKVMSTYKSVMSTSEAMSRIICGVDQDVLVLKCTVLNVQYCVVLFALWTCVLNFNNLLHVCVCAMHVYHICVINKNLW